MAVGQDVGKAGDEVGEVSGVTAVAASLQLGGEVSLIGQSLYVQAGTCWNGMIAVSALVPALVR